MRRQCSATPATEATHPGAWWQHAERNPSPPLLIGSCALPHCESSGWNAANPSKHRRTLVSNVSSGAPQNPNGVERIEAIVLHSADWRRTTAALEAAGIAEAAVREDVYPKTRLSFFKAGDIQLELVAPTEVDPAKAFGGLGQGSTRTMMGNNQWTSPPRSGTSRSLHTCCYRRRNAEEGV